MYFINYQKNHTQNNEVELALTTFAVDSIYTAAHGELSWLR